MWKATLKEYSEEEYDNFLDDCYGDIDVCWYKYPASKVLYEVDPTAYRVSMSDRESSMDDIWICKNCWEEFPTQEEAEECCIIEKDNKEVLPTKK